MPNITTTVLTVRDVAERCLVSRRTIYNLIRARDIPAIKIGGQYRIPVDALERRLAVPDGTSGPDPQPAA